MASRCCLLTRAKDPIYEWNETAIFIYKNFLPLPFLEVYAKKRPWKNCYNAFFSRKSIQSKAFCILMQPTTKYYIHLDSHPNNS